MEMFGTLKMLMCNLFCGGGDLRKCMVCTLMKMLTFTDDPLKLCFIESSVCVTQMALVTAGSGIAI